jgi:hypothetical protein
MCLCVCVHRTGRQFEQRLFDASDIELDGSDGLFRDIELATEQRISEALAGREQVFQRRIARA